MMGGDSYLLSDKSLRFRWLSATRLSRRVDADEEAARSQPCASDAEEGTTRVHWLDVPYADLAGGSRRWGSTSWMAQISG